MPELPRQSNGEPRTELGRVAKGLGLLMREVPSPPGTAPWELSDAQLDGLECVDCGGRGGAMVPLPEEGPRGQLFRHLDACVPVSEQTRGAWEGESDG